VGWFPEYTITEGGLGLGGVGGFRVGLAFHALTPRPPDPATHPQASPGPPPPPPLSMELKAAGFKGRYLAEYLAVSGVTRRGDAAGYI